MNTFKLTPDEQKIIATLRLCAPDDRRSIVAYLERRAQRQAANQQAFFERKMQKILVAIPALKLDQKGTT